jgi:hypothetical protein
MKSCPAALISYVRGNSGASWARCSRNRSALDSRGWPMKTRAHREVSRESRAVAKSPDICARSIASCHGSETRPPERRNYAEQLSVSVLAYGCEEERVKFSPNARRQCGVSHVVTQFCSRPKPNGGWSPRVAVGMGWEN